MMHGVSLRLTKYPLDLRVFELDAGVAEEGFKHGERNLEVDHRANDSAGYDQLAVADGNTVCARRMDDWECHRILDRWPGERYWVLRRHGSSKGELLA